MDKALYTMIEQFIIKAHCAEPMHIGSGDKDKGYILLDEESNQPFIPATGLAGVFRSCYEEKFGREAACELFGTIANAEMPDSLIKFSDGKFLTSGGTVKVEIRPRLALDPATGTVSSSKTKGEGIASGHKFEMQYVGTGAELQFEITIRSVKSYVDNLSECFSEINNGSIRFGGQKSNGCGVIYIDNVEYSRYDMKDKTARSAWEVGKSYNEKKLEIKEKKSSMAYTIHLSGKTDGEMLVKAISSRIYDSDSPDAENIRNALDEYIVPGSSVKGAVRNRMNMIRKYLGLPEDVIYHAFGRAEDKGISGYVGNISFRDIVVGDKKSNSKSPVRNRIHIDKFSGAVINGNLFSEKNVHGKLKIEIQISDNRYSDETFALLIFALRDLAAETYSLGSGYNIGKGFIKTDEIEVETGTGQKMCISYDETGKAEMDDRDSIIKKAMESLKLLKQEV
ncbi:RAMP superfamily CRISPR-associated protein [Oribacterium sp. FC2011]|uniref:RAMP superfamily CRISPR-associated protein n=1 Tax=Oribacterium sp. FC2011 TaxID=1408311 RepID=UPI0004E20439|nr:RAMP superfamily CRISPR-associated protein [Oribacterium sp. FC2011]